MLPHNMLFAILQKYDFSSKSQLCLWTEYAGNSCLRYCKSTIFQANHNPKWWAKTANFVVCDTAKVRFFKQITTHIGYETLLPLLFAILQKYDFSSKSQPEIGDKQCTICCLRYCKSTIFQANHNTWVWKLRYAAVVCDTAKVRFFKQITTTLSTPALQVWLFAILQKYDFSSKSQLAHRDTRKEGGCLRYCKSTIFQANHNRWVAILKWKNVVCDTAKVRFFKQITTSPCDGCYRLCCLRYCKSTIFQANHNNLGQRIHHVPVVCDTAKVRFFKQITTYLSDHSMVSCCLRYCKSTIFQANHNLVHPMKWQSRLFAILQKYDFSSKSQPI